jgi:hypothetical protein
MVDLLPATSSANADPGRFIPSRQAIVGMPRFFGGSPPTAAKVAAVEMARQNIETNYYEDDGRGEAAP